MIRQCNILAITALVLMLMSAATAMAQRYPERRWVRAGNRQYERGHFERSIERYMGALQRDSSSFEALYDLGNALFRVERADNAQQMLARAAADSTRSDADRADAFFNLGDVQLARQDLQGALESFKNALRLNPSDMEAKYNYAYVKKLLEQQQDDDQNQDNQDNKDNQDNNDNQQNQPQNGDDPQQNDGDGKDDRNDDGGDDDRNDDGGDDDRSGGERPKSAISPEQAEAMLEAIQAQEDKTQDKVKERQGVIVRGKKNW